MTMRAAIAGFGLFLLLPAVACAKSAEAGYPGVSGGASVGIVDETDVPYPGAGYIDDAGNTVPYPPAPGVIPPDRPLPRVTPMPTIPRVLCTQEAKICPNGKAVTRTGPHCEFTPCD